MAQPPPPPFPGARPPFPPGGPPMQPPFPGHGGPPPPGAPPGMPNPPPPNKQPAPPAPKGPKPPPEDKQPLNTVPSRTVYVSNLNEKVPLETLKKTLRTLGQSFGEVLDVVAHENIRMRGQAFIAFADEASAAKAIESLQHFPLYERQIVVQYARDRSDVHAKLDGDFDAHKQKRLERKEIVRSQPLPGSHKDSFKAAQNKKQQRVKGQVKAEDNPPSASLFLQKLPASVTEEMLEPIFSSLPGFKSVSHVPIKAVAMIHYETIGHAMAAKQHLEDTPVNEDYRLKIAYAIPKQ